ncbi:MAG: site-specific integrase [Oceanococcus sp.]|nr:MAG: site-specific integrase [Oceanococcus sp.]
MTNLAYSFPSINDLSDGSAVFHPTMRIWASHFDARRWAFSDSDKIQNPDTAGNCIDWETLELGTNFHHKVVGYLKLPLSSLIVDDLKIAASIYAHYPNILKSAKSHVKKPDPKTVKARIVDARNFLAFIASRSRGDFGVETKTLEDVSFDMLRRYIPQFKGRAGHLKRGLSLLADPLIQKNLRYKPQWGRPDLESKSLRWQEETLYTGIERLTDGQFLWFLGLSKQRICEFKAAMGLEILDSDARTAEDDVQLPCDCAEEALDQWLQTDRLENRFKRTFGITKGDFWAWVTDVHLLSMWVIATFTGMRESELQLLMTDSLIERNGFKFLRSKVLKGKKKRNRALNDEWIAIDLVVDAFEILCFLQAKRGNKFLFAPISVPPTGRPFALGALNTKFKRWISKHDTEGLFENDIFSIHRCRETLVYQLAKHEVGLPFISMQLKHFNHRFKKLPNEVTAGYGNYKEVVFDGINKHKSEARRNVFTEVYGESSKFAGGGASGHRQRIDAFFTGLGLFGDDRVAYINRMANQNIKLMPTSIGLCNHNFITATEDKPPCYGDFSCDPDCPQHVLTKSCGNILQSRKKHIQEVRKAESNPEKVIVWDGLIGAYDKHLKKLEDGNNG